VTRIFLAQRERERERERVLGGILFSLGKTGVRDSRGVLKGFFERVVGGIGLSEEAEVFVGIWR
jgi:hypothetical protein